MTAGVPATRLDAELVRRGLARSRRRAAELVAEGRVRVGGTPADKPSLPVPADVLVEVEPSGPDYVSRGGHKLAGALDQIQALAPGEPRVLGAPCLDAGASTGGFTQVLLDRGAASVLAVDVGHDQLVAELRADARVTSCEGFNVRDLRPEAVDIRPTVVVADLSFISLTLVIPALLGVCAPGADLLLLVKPQFEVGRGRLGAGGVVTSPERRRAAVLAVAEAAVGAGARVRAVVPSPLPGPAGNLEYFLWLTAPAGGPRWADVSGAVAEAVASAVLEGSAALVRPPLVALPGSDG